MIGVLSVLQAFIDNQAHGVPVRDNDIFTTAQHTQRCTECGYQIEVGDVIVMAERPTVYQRELWVHGECPTDHLVRLRWLWKRRGSDLVERYREMSWPQTCHRCGRRSQQGDLYALVRLPGTSLADARHSAYVCLDCLRV